MGMKKGEKIHRWIDLSVLPHDNRGRIQWKKSVGCEIRFVYGDVNGVLKILKCDKFTNQAIIFVDDYTDKDGASICVDQLKTCSLGGVLKKPIAETHPELIMYFENKEDAYRYSAHSGKKVKMICPVCRAVKEQIIEHLTDRGFACDSCSDGKSWPEKFMYNILKQTGVYFLNEVTRSNNGFEWVGSYRYDFYIEKDNKKYMVEMDGALHFGDFFQTYSQSRLTDEIKDTLVKEKNIKMIRINCNYDDLTSRFEFVKYNIIQSELSQILDLTLIDWDRANEIALDSNIKRAAQMWNEGIKDKKKIAKNLGVTTDSVRAYLSTAEKIGISTYSLQRDKEMQHDNLKRINSKPVILIKDGIEINVFSSATELDRKSFELYGVHILKQHAADVCRGDRAHTRGYTMRYITREEYERLAPQFNQTIQN